MCTWSCGLCAVASATLPALWWRGPSKHQRSRLCRRREGLSAQLSLGTDRRATRSLVMMIIIVIAKRLQFWAIHLDNTTTGKLNSSSALGEDIWSKLAKSVLCIGILLSSGMIPTPDVRDRGLVKFTHQPPDPFLKES